MDSGHDAASAGDSEATVSVSGHEETRDPRRGKDPQVDSGAEEETPAEESTSGDEEYRLPVTDPEVIEAYRQRGSHPEEGQGMGKGRVQLDELQASAALFKVKKADRSGRNVPLELKFVRAIIPEKRLISASKMTDLSFALGTEVREWGSPRLAHRACDYRFGMAFYSKSGQYGVRFPFSQFIVDILVLLKIPPGQLTGVAWCALNSFDYFFIEHRHELTGVPVPFPTVGMFLHLYSFMADKSWVTVKKRSKTNKFKPISKLDQWNKGWFYLTPESEVFKGLVEVGVSPAWRETVTLPGRPEISWGEQATILRIMEICEGADHTSLCSSCVGHFVSCIFDGVYFILLVFAEMDKDGKGAPLSFAGLEKDAMKANKNRREARLAQMETELQAEVEKRNRLSTEEEEEEREEKNEGEK